MWPLTRTCPLWQGRGTPTPAPASTCPNETKVWNLLNRNGQCGLGLRGRVGRGLLTKQRAEELKRRPGRVTSSQEGKACELCRGWTVPKACGHARSRTTPLPWRLEGSQRPSRAPRPDWLGSPSPVPPWGWRAGPSLCPGLSLPILFTTPRTLLSQSPLFVHQRTFGEHGQTTPLSYKHPSPHLSS